MANTNTNLMSVNTSRSANTSSSSQSSSKYKNATQQIDRKNNFDSHLNKANEQVNPNQQQPKEIDNSQNAASEVENAATALPASTQGQNTKSQDAPQQENLETPTEKISDDMEEISETSGEGMNPAVFSYLFSTSTETLLTPKIAEVSAENNLTAIMPQENGSQSQTMLDLLGGKTWSSADVAQEVKNLNSQQIEIQPTQNLNSQQIQNQPTQNLNSQQVEIQPQNLNSQQVEIQPTQNLNSQQVQNQPQNFGSEIPQVVNSIQPQAEAKQVQPTVQNLADMLGANVQVEDGQQISPAIQVQQNFQNFEQNNSRQDAQNFSQNFSQSNNFENQQAISQTAEGEESFATNLNPVANNQPQIQQTAQIQNPEVAANVREDFNIPTQIVEQARLIRNAQNTEMVINLKPEHLGELTLRISVSHGGTLTANFYSDNAQVRAIIDNSLVQLKQELSNAGIKVENVQVFAGLSDGGLANGQGGRAWQQNQQKNSNRRIDFNAFEEEADAIQSVGENEVTDGVDYKV